MARPSAVEATEMGREDSGEAIELARVRGAPYPVATIADGAERDAQSTGFHKRWWRQQDEDWPEALREAYNEAFTRELMAARVAVVELQFDAAGGKKWTNVGVVDLQQWEPTFPFDPASTGWIRQDPRSRVGWRRRSFLRKLRDRKRAGSDPST
ncbi:MAG TPA: hypothetical protein VH299_14190 [Solirubrobacterales bacterium]|jgi:hypothetical protein|nr:hypothetical protein [Solirubrobacterales bacterium]